MLIRFYILALLLSTAAIGQFIGLSSNSDGSLLYFASTLRLKGTPQPLNGKIFTATKDGLSLYRAQPRIGRPPRTPLCRVEGFEEYVGAESAESGTIALYYQAATTGCSFPMFTASTQLLARSGERTFVGGVARLSADGRFAIVYSPKTARLYDGVHIDLLDLQSGTSNSVEVPPPGYLIPWQSRTGGRVIANDGTALVAFRDRGYLVKAGIAAEPFPVQNGVPFFIDSIGVKVLYSRSEGVWPVTRNEGLYLLDLRTLESTMLIPADQRVDPMGMSDDARRILFIRDGQVRLLDTTTLADTLLTNDPAGVSRAIISGDGRVVYAATRQGGLLRIEADEGSTVHIIRRTPYFDPFSRPTLAPGLATFLTGSALADTSTQGSPPFTPYLENLTMWIGERKVPVISLAPTSVRFLVPWDIAPGPARIMAEVSGDQTPFHFPELEVIIPAPGIATGALARQDWTRTYSGPIKTGEIIHVLAIGLGPVSPEVADGYAAPAIEPFARTTQPLTCSNAEVLYAGLSPGSVERVYQVDLRITAPAGYQKFFCTLGNSNPFLFLSLNIVD